jgi:hypothetical protein
MCTCVCGMTMCVRNDILAGDCLQLKQIMTSLYRTSSASAQKKMHRQNSRLEMNNIKVEQRMKVVNRPKHMTVGVRGEAPGG